MMTKNLTHSTNDELH